MQFERFTERARRIVDHASAEASRLGDSSVDTVHLLLGMIRESEGIAGVALERHGVEADAILEAHPSVCDEPDVPFADVEMRSKEEASWLKHHYAGTEHLLLGLCCMKHSRAVRLLEQLGKHPRDLCQFVVAILGHDDEVWERWLVDHPDMAKD